MYYNSCKLKSYFLLKSFVKTDVESYEIVKTDKQSSSMARAFHNVGTV